ncbi:hypothetical protein PHLGIDRAFT_104800 [Phlebiopsis gigantea 11061_1 CR5-6]|uniref:Probable 26S proteasome regulatory subunit p27 n=1 Tax=Phlebiopsis gigantea (strain 11061_1 CR5-6) TaxID=745531 RepID=A0A0C3SBL5_PHLG1|nr:hypothetical protein PHLGIDRAFT_104800 [Phlebiopsis gigantea 11061_1 CR5-6]
MGMELPSRNSPAEQVRALVLRKDAIEAEIDAQASVLKTNNVTMQSPLVDPEGFPRADIDVWEVRHARVRIIELRNDLKDIMDQIMKGLQGVYDPAIVAEASQSETSSPSGMKPFAKVDGVAPGSPAVAAGLLKEDLILSFGSLTQSSFSANSLQPLASLAAAHENREVPVQILRGKDEILTLKLLPRKGWGGRGLLGCHIVPYAS